MVRFGSLFCLVALALLAATSTGWSAEQPLTKLQSRQLPETLVRDRVLKQFGDTLLSEPYPQRSPPRLLLRALYYNTRARSGGFEGLCVSEQVIFKFRPVGKEAGPETPTTVRSLTVEPFYYVPGAAPLAESRDFDVRHADDNCAKIDPRKTSFFSAPSEEIAVAGAQAFEQLRRIASTPQGKALIDCSEFGPQCDDQLARTGLQAITDVTACMSSDGECITVGLMAGLAVDIVMNADDQTIIRAKAAQVVVVNEAKAD